MQKVDNLYGSAVGGAWYLQRAWSTANLPFRLAYPLRLVLEGQPRIAAFGLDSVINNPRDYWNYLSVLDESVLGEKLCKTHGAKKQRVATSIRQSSSKFKWKTF